MNELEKIKHQHNFKMQKLKLQGELSIEESKIKNTISLNKLNAEKEQLSVTESIRELKNTVKKDKSIIKSGKFLNFWGTLGTIISTLLTIAGLWEFFNDSYLKAITFILAIVLTQFSVYILAKQDTNIRKHFMQHASKVGFLKLVLLTISIYGNYTFFTTGRAITLIEAITIISLCIAIDLISIYCISIAQDFKMLNKNTSADNLYKGLLHKILFNMTYKFVSRIENNYQNNKSASMFVQDKDSNKQLTYRIVSEDENNNIASNFVQDKDTIKNTVSKLHPENKNISAFVQDKEIEKIKNAILAYKDGNICPSLSALSDITGITKNKIVEAKKILEKRGLIKTKGKTTFVNEKIENA
jgi:hypothetical protein